MDFSFEMAIYAVLISFLCCVLICPLFIPFLTKLKFGQFVRNDGPSSHLKKSGTPTMGGVVILLSFAVSSLFFVRGNEEGIAVMAVTLLFGVIGFADDYVKVVKKRSLGLRAYQKMIAQILVCSLFAYYIVGFADIGTEVYIPFSQKTWDLGVVFLPFVYFVVIGTVNSVNLTDGLDGLASGITVMVATFFMIMAWALNSGVAAIAGAAVGSLLGFLLFNSYPAKVFMGDTGSLALGGFIAAAAIVMRMPLYLAIVGLIYVVESLSVMIQVGYYKKTKKRIFKMAPIHHHFELLGYSETRIVMMFYVITALLCLLGFLGAKYIVFL